MPDLGRYKLSDALNPSKPEAREPKGGKPATTHETAAEQVREAREDEEARDNQASNREHMVDIGRGNQQAGRQGQ